MKRFELHVPESVLSDLHDRLSKTKWPIQETNDWSKGANTKFLKRLVKHWSSKYDWRFQEKSINKMGPHFITSIQGLQIHFIHCQNDIKLRRTPLLLVHGWPCSFLVFQKTIDRLSRYFDLIIPSIPGYGFSQPAKLPGMHCANVARILDELIVSRLGYPNYYAHGGESCSFSLSLFLSLSHTQNTHA